MTHTNPRRPKNNNFVLSIMKNVLYRFLLVFEFTHFGTFTNRSIR